MNRPQKYIAKLLPVEGVPQNGDIVMGKNGVCVVYGDKGRHNLQHYDKEFIEQISKVRKAKLFLCSDDIQPGDKYIVPNDMEWHTHIEGATFPFADGVKIVAEISSKAIWVKDGDIIFEEDTYKRFIPIEDNEDSGSHREYEAGLKYLNMTNWKAFAWIKCKNCETFH